MTTTAPSDREAIAVFAHEFREPLASILFAVQSMYESTDDERANREMCEVVERQARFLAQMIDEVLDASRCRYGKIRLHKASFDLGAVMMAAVETTRPLFTQRRHRLAVELPDEPLFVVADPVRLQQVVTNLLTNAAKYTEPGGSIRLSAGPVDDLVVLEVRDDGTGISADLLPRVFDLFEQGSAPRGSGWYGMGIGLALVKSLVELHGGSVSAHSDGPGAGSAFVIRLPCRGFGEAGA